MRKFFSNKSIKLHCLNSLLTVINKTSEKPNKLIVLTANGIYTGTLKKYDDSDNYEVTDDDDLLTVYHKTYLEASDNLKIDETDKDEVIVAENPISITLENVEIRSVDNKAITTLPFVEIFIDQIIGFSLGSFSDKDD